MSALKNPVFPTNSEDFHRQKKSRKRVDWSVKPCDGVGVGAMKATAML
jgi:hypothetical protein